MSNDVNDLMERLAKAYDEVLDKDVTHLVGPDIDIVIAYQRKHRVAVEAGGGKAKREKGPGLSLDSVLGLTNLIAKPSDPGFKRRF